MTLDIAVGAPLAMLRATIITLRASLCKDYTMLLPLLSLGGANPYKERLLKLN
jgi:hypothetical protein